MLGNGNSPCVWEGTLGVESIQGDPKSSGGLVKTCNKHRISGVNNTPKKTLPRGSQALQGDSRMDRGASMQNTPH